MKTEIAIPAWHLADGLQPLFEASVGSKVMHRSKLILKIKLRELGRALAFTITLVKLALALWKNCLSIMWLL